jgi:hypothetical protein
MSPEASLLAKLSVATPLETVDDTPEAPSIPESVSELSPAREDVQPEIADVSQATPAPVTTRDTKSDLEELLKTVDDTPTQPVVEEAAATEVVTVAQVPPTPTPVSTREEAPEASAENTLSKSVGTADGYLQSQGIMPEAVTSSSLVPSVEQDTSKQAILEPEEVPAPETEAMPEATHAQHSSVVADDAEVEIPPSVILENIAPKSDPSAVLAQSAVEDLAQAVAGSEVSKDSAKDEDGEDLYSMKNFSL